MSFGEVASALSIVDWVRKYFLRCSPENRERDTIYFRFLRVFEVHGIQRNQIPQIFPDLLCVADVQSESTLMPKLSEKVLSETCRLFNIRRNWLDCVDDYMFETHDFYKQPDLFDSFLDDLINKGNPLRGVVCRGKKLKRQTPIVIIIAETIKTLGHIDVTRYHICPFGNGGYFKTQGYLTACIALAWKKNIYVRGITIKRKGLINFIDGVVNSPFEEALRNTSSWYAEDMVSNVESYLENVNPESNQFGYKASLDLWLDLHEKGYMNAGFGPVSSIPFKDRLNSYQNDEL